MVASKWLQMALGSLGMLIWLALYVLARFANRDMRRWETRVVATMVGLVVVWAGLRVTDHNHHIANVFLLNFLGLVCAWNWLRMRHRRTDANAMTILNLSGNRPPDR
jgi:hypothetical protein